MNVRVESWQKNLPQHIPPYQAGQDVPWLSKARQAAFERFMAQGLPTRRDEEWKYTDLAAIGKRASLIPDTIPHDPSHDAALFAWSLAQENVHLMVFVNGVYAAGLSALGKIPRGVKLENLAHLLNGKADLPEAYFGHLHEHTVFTALNNAYASDGAVLQMAPGTVLEHPVYLLFIGSGPNTSSYPRNILLLGEGAHATVIEHYFSSVDARNFTNALTQINLAADAGLSHCKLQQEGQAAFHIAGIHVEQAARSSLTSHSFALGARLSRNDITSRLNGAECLCTFNGLYLQNNKQHADHHTRIDHLAPAGISRECYRGILDGESHGVFNGKIVVDSLAINTDAQQTNQNLLLSPKAEVDTQPQLEIFADEVKCTHGATVGHLDDASLFYLCTRGIDAATARSLLTFGFANDIISRVKWQALRNRIEQLVLDCLPHGEQLKELL
jgi:Fe-S cluster assembly protein SufD